MQYRLTPDQYENLAGRHAATKPRYEGRALFGTPCLAYAGSHPRTFISDLADTLAERTGQDPHELRNELVRSHRTDVLLFEQIVYWPAIQVDP
ncbi:MAG: hypothetical protein WAX14_02015 [Rhodococcus sp. (in: high G+C Gram-positive bacteria)]|uniref:hypothetical protein n=1 Tax=Rhodococcus sp. TaxID=1831 RepID=UPI003BB5DA3F